MTTLVDVPSVTALHLPTPTSSPVPLSAGDLTLTVIPANPPTHPSATLTLSVGTASFPLLPITPVQRIAAKDEHASYIFSPASADGGASIGQVKLTMKDSTSQGEWEATEALCRKFEGVLQEWKVWDEKTLFVDDEFERAGQPPAQGWGQTVAGAVMGAGQALAQKLSTFTEGHVAQTNPTHPAPPSEAVAQQAKNVNTTTGHMAEMAATGAAKFGDLVHEGGKRVGEKLPDSIAKAADPVAEADKSDLRKMAEGGWEQVTIAAKGIANAAVTVGGAVSQNAHKAVEHNFGKEAESVAQDIGQSGANLGSTGASAFQATSVIIQGSNAASGAAASREGQA